MGVGHHLIGAAKRRIAPILCNGVSGRLAGALFRDSIPHHGLRIDTSHPSVTPRVKAAILFRGYESAEYRFARKYLPRDIDVIELGGSIGVLSCIIRRDLDPARRLVTVEADPDLIPSLRRTLDLNGLAGNVEIVSGAIAYDGATARFSRFGSSEIGHLAYDGCDDWIEVPALQLSELIAERQLADYCIVSDVEGVEHDILAHDLSTLAAARLIIMETHDLPGQDFVRDIMATGLFRLIDRHGAVIVLTQA